MRRVTHFRVVTAAVLVSALTFGTAACGGSSSPAASSASAVPSTDSPSATATKAKHKGVRGTVTAISATSLTITRKNGASQTFALDASTNYGNKKQPLRPTDIKTGEMVVVTPGADGAPAIRVALAKQQSATPTASPTAS